NIIDKKIDQKSTFYSVLQYLVRTAKNTLYLWKTVRKNSKNLFIAIKWFILFFLQKDVLSPLFSLVTHFKEREEFLKCNIINIKHKTQHCEVESTYPSKDNLISFNEYVSFMGELEPKYLFFKLSNSWHLNDLFRR